MESKFTPEQLQAIDAKGSFVIVSAAAGSGKTTVLIEKLIKILSDCENKIRADRLVIVTFTNDAASQIQRKLSKAVNEAVLSCANEDREKKNWLLIQKNYLNFAKISTISSFCFDIIREHSEDAKVNLDFKIADESQAKLLLIKSIEDVSDEWFSDDEKKEKISDIFEFFKLYNNVSDDKETKYQEIIKLRSFLLTIPFYKERFIDIVLSDYKKGLDENFKAADTGFGSMIFCYFKKILSDSRLKDSVDFVYSNLNFAINNPDIIEEKCEKKYAKKAFLNSYEYIKILHDYLENHVTELDCDDFINDYFDNAAKAFQITGDLFRLDLKSSTKKTYLKAINELCENSLASPEELLESCNYIGRSFIDISGILPCTSSELKSDYAHHYKLLSEIYEFLESINTRYSKLKNDKNILDFTDAELLTLSIFGQIQDGKIVKTKLAESLSDEYDMILIDEFQDSNDLQDIIFRLISHNGNEASEGKNMFIVGDMKQSIYNFRLANPEIFHDYLKNSENYSDKIISSSPKNILLNKNFRSSRKVISFVNLVFSKIMTEKTGGIDYDDTQKLIYSDDIWEKQNEDFIRNFSDFDTEILLLDKQNLPFDEEEITPSEKTDTDDDSAMEQLEAKAISLKIRKLLDENKNLHPKDICVLCRTNNDVCKLSSYISELNIPVITDDSGGFIESREISFAVNYLKIIDNPHNNTALAGVMMSPVFMFSPDDMAILSTLRNDESYFTLLNKVTESTEYAPYFSEEFIKDVGDFLFKLNNLRNYSASHTAYDLIRKIYMELSVKEIYSLYPDGEKRIANLDLLCEYANNIENDSPGIYSLLRLLDNIYNNKRLDFSASNISSGSDDAVIVKTIHKSKGLEFPIVFLCLTGSRRNNDNSDLYYGKKYGIAFYVNDEKNLTSYPSLPLQVIKKQNEFELSREYMRLMYVALTRAKCKLYISGSLTFSDSKAKCFCPENAVRESGLYRDFECDITASPMAKKIKDVIGDYPEGTFSGGKLNDDLFMTKWSNMLQLIISALYLDGKIPFFGGKNLDYDVPVKVKLIRYDDKLFKKFKYSGKTQDNKVLSFGEIDEDYYHKIQKFSEYDFSDKFLSDREKEKIPAKLTVTEITHRTTLDLDEIIFPKFLPYHDKFYVGKSFKSELSSAEKGTAVHNFLHYADFHSLDEKIISVEDEAYRLNIEGFISEKQAKFISENKKIQNRILNFLDSELWKCYIKNAKKEDVLTEVPFMAKLSDIFDINGEKSLDIILKTYYNNSYEDTFVQGVADLIIRNSDGFVLIDYKTNEGKTLKELKDMYKTQLLLYKSVFEKIYLCEGKAFIYSLGIDSENPFIEIK